MRVVGLDFGIKRIGLAVGDPSGTLARPVETIAAGATLADTVHRVLASIRALEAQDEPVGVICRGTARPSRRHAQRSDSAGARLR